MKKLLHIVREFGDGLSPNEHLVYVDSIEFINGEIIINKGFLSIDGGHCKDTFQLLKEWLYDGKTNTIHKMIIHP